MRLSTITRFPHPVLEEVSSDYSSGMFGVEFSVSECRNTGSITIRQEVELSQPDITALVHEDRASVIVFVECLRTYYNQPYNIPIGVSEITFDKGELRDTVRLRPYVVAVEEILDFQCSDLHEEFGREPWTFQRSDVLAVAPQITIDVGLEKLAPMESIFNLSISEEVPEGRTQLKLDEPKITILASKKTIESLNRFRTSGFGKLCLLNGVYLPVLMRVLDALKSGGSIYQDYRWHGVFEATCIHLGIDTEDPSLLEDAQTLFKSPLGRLLEAREFKL